MILEAHLRVFPNREKKRKQRFLKDFWPSSRKDRIVFSWDFKTRGGAILGRRREIRSLGSNLIIWGFLVSQYWHGAVGKAIAHTWLKLRGEVHAGDICLRADI